MHVYNSIRKTVGNWWHVPVKGLCATHSKVVTSAAQKEPSELEWCPTVLRVPTQTWKQVGSSRALWTAAVGTLTEVLYPHKSHTQRRTIRFLTICFLISFRASSDLKTSGQNVRESERQMGNQIPVCFKWLCSLHWPVVSLSWTPFLF